MSETEKVFENLIKDTRKRAIDSYRTALKKKIEGLGSYKIKQISNEVTNEAGYLGRIPTGHLPSYRLGIKRGIEKALELIDQTTIEK